VDQKLGKCRRAVSARRGHNHDRKDPDMQQKVIGAIGPGRNRSRGPLPPPQTKPCGLVRNTRAACHSFAQLAALRRFGASLKFRRFVGRVNAWAAEKSVLPAHRASSGTANDQSTEWRFSWSETVVMVVPG